MAKNGQLNGWGYETVPQPGLGGRRGYQPRGKVLGGSSSINAMVYARGHASDYDAWAAEGNPGWGWADVLPYFKRAEHNERGADAFHGTGGPLNVKDLTSPHPLLAPFRAGRTQEAGYVPSTPTSTARSRKAWGIYQVTHRNGERYSAAKAYLTPHLGRPNLTVSPTPGHLAWCSTEEAGQVSRAPPAWNTAGRAGEWPDAAAALQGGRRGGAERGCLRVAAAAHALGHRAGGPPAVEHGIAVVRDLPGVGGNLHDHPDVVLVMNAPQGHRSVRAVVDRAPMNPLRALASGAAAAAACSPATSPRRAASSSSAPDESDPGPAIALRGRQAGRSRPQDGVRPWLFVPCLPAAAAQPGQRCGWPARPAGGALIDPPFCRTRTTCGAWCRVSRLMRDC
jgi:choline dehydrogenase-like flavoprotein